MYFVCERLKTEKRSFVDTLSLSIVMDMVSADMIYTLRHDGGEYPIASGSVSLGN